MRNNFRMSENIVHLELYKRIALTAWEQRFSKLTQQLEHIDLLPDEESNFYDKFVNAKLIACCDDELNPDFFEKYKELRKFGLTYKEAMYTLGFSPGKAKAIAEGRCVRSWKLYKKFVDVELKVCTEMRVEALRTLYKGLVNGNLKAATFYLEKRFPSTLSAVTSGENINPPSSLEDLRKKRLETLRREKPNI